MFPCLSFPAFLLEQHVRELSRSRTLWLDCPVAVIRRRHGELELLARRLPSPGAPFLRLQLADRLVPLDLRSLPKLCVGALQLGLGGDLGRAVGWVRATGGSWEPLSELRLVGPGMRTVSLLGAGEARPRDEELEERWSRTIGALGGLENWRRLTALHVGLIGCGRLGSLAANSLGRLGVKNLTLVDCDRVEAHNLGESEFGPADIGQPKALALQERIARECPATEIHAVVQTATHLEAIEALKSSDVLFAQPDLSAARLRRRK